MEISEQVGMTPEIIQKVWVFCPPHCINHYSYKLSIYLSMCLLSVCSFKTKLPSSLQKERRYYTALLLCYIIYNCCDTVLYNVTLLELCYFIPQRGKTVPEELVRAEDLSKYRQVASHAVSLDFYMFENCFFFFFFF